MVKIKNFEKRGKKKLDYKPDFKKGYNHITLANKFLIYDGIAIWIIFFFLEIIGFTEIICKSNVISFSFAFLPVTIIK